MSSHTPTVVTPIAVTGSWSAGNYVHNGTGYEYNFYWNGVSNNDSVPRSIKYNNTTRRWEDNGGGFPEFFDAAGTQTTTAQNPANVLGYDASGNNYWSFVNPYYDSSWSTGNQQNYGSSSPSYNFTGVFALHHAASNQWKAMATGKNTSVADYIYLYDSLPTSTSVETPIAIVTFLPQSIDTTKQMIFTLDLTKTYYIINFRAGLPSSTPYEETRQILAKYPSSKKVHSNFW